MPQQQVIANKPTNKVKQNHTKYSLKPKTDEKKKRNKETWVKYQTKGKTTDLIKSFQQLL